MYERTDLWRTTTWRRVCSVLIDSDDEPMDADQVHALCKGLQLWQVKEVLLKLAEWGYVKRGWKDEVEWGTAVDAQAMVGTYRRRITVQTYKLNELGRKELERRQGVKERLTVVEWSAYAPERWARLIAVLYEVYDEALSVKKLQQKCAELSERELQNMLDLLTKEGMASVMGDADAREYKMTRMSFSDIDAVIRQR